MSATRARNPRGQGERLRAPLIDATVATIAETGDVSKVSVRAIAKRAGVSPTALYLHFPDRDAAVEAAIDAGFEAFNAAILDGDDPAAPPRERCRVMGEAYLAFAESQPQLYSVIFTAARPAKEGGEIDRGAGFAGLVQVVAGTGAEQPEAVAVAMWSALHGYAMLLACGTPAGDFEPADAFVRRLGQAFLP